MRATHTQVWNWQFEVATYNLHMANTSVVVHGDPNHLNYDNWSVSPDDTQYST